MKLYHSYDTRFGQFTITEALEHELNALAPDGQLENALHIARHTFDEYCKLVEKLHSLGILREQDILDLVGPSFEEAPE
jgi:hypothetical protein